MRTPCACEIPEDWEQNPGLCQRCGHRILPKWQTNTGNVNEFFGQLQSLPGVPRDFIIQCVEREAAGREEFGYEYLGRNNVKEASEESADFGVYLYLHVLKKRRQGKDALEPALRAAHLIAQAHAILAEMDG